jgi:hypothetical protein
MSEWLHEEGSLDADLAFIGESSSRIRSAARSAGKDTAEHNLAVFLKPLVVDNTRKWFGETDIRVDALVSQAGQDTGALFQPKTFRFPRVADGDNLANEDNGLMVYYGKPKHFLVLTVTLARDTKDSDDLAVLIEKQSKSDEVSTVLTKMAAAVASPHIAAVQTAMQAALTLGNVAYQLVRQISPKCLGLYRTNWLAKKDKFGVGRHPADGLLNIKDFNFAYEVVQDKADG